MKIPNPSTPRTRVKVEMPPVKIPSSPSFSLSIVIQGTPDQLALLREIGAGNPHATEALATVLTDQFMKTLVDKVNGEWKARLNLSS